MIWRDRGQNSSSRTTCDSVDSVRLCRCHRSRDCNRGRQNFRSNGLRITFHPIATVEVRYRTRSDGVLCGLWSVDTRSFLRSAAGYVISSFDRAVARACTNVQPYTVVTRERLRRTRPCSRDIMHHCTKLCRLMQKLYGIIIMVSFSYYCLNAFA